MEDIVPSQPQPPPPSSTSLVSRKGYGAPIPYHVNPDNLNDTDTPDIRIAADPQHPNCFVVHFRSLGQAFVNALAVEANLMGAENGVELATAHTPNTLEFARVMLRLTLRPGTGIKDVLQTLVQRLRRKFAAAEQAFRRDIVDAKTTATTVAAATRN